MQYVYNMYAIQDFCKHTQCCRFRDAQFATNYLTKVIFIQVLLVCSTRENITTLAAVATSRNYVKMLYYFTGINIFIIPLRLIQNSSRL